MMNYMHNAGENFKRILDELNRQAQQKEDFVVPANQVRMRDDGHFTFQTLFTNATASPATEWAENQMYQKLELPARFMRRCPSDLRATNFNYFAERLPGEEEWLLRTYRSRSEQLGPMIRGALSKDYSRFDDDQFLGMIESMIGTEEDHRISYWYRDERGMHLRIVFPDLTRNIGRTLEGRPDVHMVGVHLSNSEVGARSVTIQPMVYRLVCSNGLMRWTNDGDVFKQRHIHLREKEMYARVAEAFTSAVKAGDDMLERALAAKEVKVENPLDFIKTLAKDKKYSQSMTDTITSNYMIEPGDNLFYVMQAMTRAAQTLQGDARVELEQDAGELLTKVAV
ncbi:DUF932 domain-containing protein [Brevibacillus sp. 179-C 1.1 NHS]